MENCLSGTKVKCINHQCGGMCQKCHDKIGDHCPVCNTEQVVECPICQEKAAWNDNPFRPFCSKRCKTQDLANWADGSYAIPTDPSESSFESVEDEELF